MKPLGLGLKKIDMCLNLCMLYYLENTKLNKCRTCWYARINPKLIGKRLLSHIENLDIFQLHLNCKGYSCHQRLLST